MQAKQWLPVTGTIGGIIVALWAAVQLWDYFFKAEDELVAHVEFAPFALPPQLDAEFERFSELRDADAIAELIELDKLLEDKEDPEAEDLVRETLSRVSWLLRERLPTSVPDEISTVDGVWFVRVNNAGPRSLSDVTITLPKARYLSVRREGGDSEHRQSGEVISLGDLRPREAVSLTAWSAFVSAHQADEIKLTHAQGIGEIVVHAPVGPLGQWVDEYGKPALIMLVVAVLYVIVMTAIQRSESKEEAKPEGGESDSGNDSEDSPA